MRDLIPSPFLDGLVFGEGPRWYSGRLWFSDMRDRKVIAADLQGDTQIVAEVPHRPSGLGFLPDGRLLIVSVADRKLLRKDPDGLKVHADLEPYVTANLNDMVVDGLGNAYVGNQGHRYDEPKCLGNICLVKPSGEVQIVATEMDFPNGTVISPDGRTMIIAETHGHRLTAFTVRSDGSLTNRRIFAQFEETVPDGIALDAEGAVWLGSYLTGEFLRVREGGEVTHRIKTPGRWAVACALGGNDRCILFLIQAETTLDMLATTGKSTGLIESVRVDTPGVGWP